MLEEDKRTIILDLRRDAKVGRFLSVVSACLVLRAELRLSPSGVTSVSEDNDLHETGRDGRGLFVPVDAVSAVASIVASARSRPLYTLGSGGGEPSDRPINGALGSGLSCLRKKRDAALFSCHPYLRSNILTLLLQAALNAGVEVSLLVCGRYGYLVILSWAVGEEPRGWDSISRSLCTNPLIAYFWT